MPFLPARAGSPLQRALLQAWSQALAALQPHLLEGLSQSAVDSLLLDALATAVRGPDASARQAALQYWERSDVQAALQGYRSVLLCSNILCCESSYLQDLAGVRVSVICSNQRASLFRTVNTAACRQPCSVQVSLYVDGPG